MHHADFTCKEGGFQDISWFLEQFKFAKLNLNPSYQRRSVWTPKDRRFFLDTIFRNYPCPPVYIYQNKDENGHTIYEVIDGKQRLETVIKFSDNKIKIADDFGDEKFSGKKIKQLDPDDKFIFWDYSIPVMYINTTDTTIVNNIFDRLNRNSKKLNEQELRHAKFDGWMISFLEAQAEESVWKDFKISTTSKSKRMSDVQNLSELLMAIICNKVIGFNQDLISYFYGVFDDPEFETDDSEETPEESSAFNNSVEQKGYNLVKNCFLSFDKEAIEERFINITKLIKDLNTKYNIIEKYASNFKHFYSLWCVVNDLENNQKFTDEFSSHYSQFMDKVTECQSMIEDENSIENIEPEVIKYYNNAMGASTEEPQRTARDEAIKDYIRKLMSN